MNPIINRKRPLPESHPMTVSNGEVEKKQGTSNSNTMPASKKIKSTTDTNIGSRTAHLTIPSKKEVALEKIRQWLDDTQKIVLHDENLDLDEKQKTIEQMNVFAVYLKSHMNSDGSITKAVLLKNSGIPSLPEGMNFKCGIFLDNLYALKYLPEEITTALLSADRCGLIKVELGSGVHIKTGATFKSCDFLTEIDLGSETPDLSVIGCDAFKILKYRGEQPLQGLSIIACKNFDDMPREIHTRHTVRLGYLPNATLPQKITLSNKSITREVLFNHVTIDDMPDIDADKIICQNCDFKGEPLRTHEDRSSRSVFQLQKRYGMPCIIITSHEGETVTFFPPQTKPKKMMEEGEESKKTRNTLEMEKGEGEEPNTVE